MVEAINSSGEETIEMAKMVVPKMTTGKVTTEPNEIFAKN